MGNKSLTPVILSPLPGTVPELLDIVLFSGASMLSKFIRGLEKFSTGNGDWSHVGIIIDSTILPLPQLIPGKKYIWESLMSSGSVPDVICGKGRSGVQIRDFDEVVKHEVTGTVIAFCRLKKNPLLRRKIGHHDETELIFNNRVLLIKNKIKKIYEKFGNAIYPRDLVKLYSALFENKAKICCSSCICVRRPKNYFCSEFVALVCENIGVRMNENISAVIPVDFTMTKTDIVHPPILYMIVV